MTLKSVEEFVLSVIAFSPTTERKKLLIHDDDIYNKVD